MLLAAERIRHIPVIRMIVLSDRTAVLDVAAVVGADVRANRTAGDRAAGRGRRTTRAVTELVADQAANDGARNRAWNVRFTAPFAATLQAWIAWKWKTALWPCSVKWLPRGRWKPLPSASKTRFR